MHVKLANTPGFKCLQEAIDLLPIPVFVKDAQGRFVLVNQVCEEAVGYPIAEIRGTLGENYYTPDELAQSQARDQQAFATGHTVHHEERYWSAGHTQRRWSQTFAKPIYDALGAPLYIVGASVDIEAQKQLQRQLDGERSLLEMLAAGSPLAEILDTFARNYESTFAGMLCSILLLDADGLHLRHGAAPSLARDYCQAVDGVLIGPQVGSCGTAAYTGQDTLVADIATDPLWKDYRDLALAHGLKACWSIPIRWTNGQILGTFAVYYGTARNPQDAELLAIKRGACMAGLAIEHDLTRKQRLDDQAALHDAAVHTLTILDNMLDGVVTISRRGLIESFNKAASAIFGYAAEEVMGRNVGILVPEPDIDQPVRHLPRPAAKGSGYLLGQSREMTGRRKDGGLFPMNMSVTKIARSGRKTFVVAIRDITQQRQHEEEIERLAFYDPLTLLPNRRLLQDRLKRALINSARTSHNGALMFLDLDHFKQLNDTLGHDMGDELLKQVAERLKTCVREGDTVARLGGDEFVVLLVGLGEPIDDSAANAKTVATKVLNALGQPYQLSGHVFECTPSVGVVVFSGDQEGTDELLKKADVAMYQAKSAGRNTVRFFDPAMQASVNAHVALEHDMRRGLAGKEFMLLYQFQVNVHGVPIGAEALLRWNHATRGLVPPAQFIAVAEESSVGHMLGQWVLETACHQLALWALQEATAHWTLAINVGPSQFGDPNFVNQVAQALKKTDATPQRLKLEVTEQMLMNDTAETRTRMNAIKALGVGFSLDDFGTGYSSLLHLQRLPLDQLKIDQSFVHDLLVHPGDAAVARSVVALGHSLGLTVIAEGVETAEQRNLLAELGCDAFQGYYFGHPAPAAELSAA